MNDVTRVDFDLDVNVEEVADLINFVNPIPGKHVYTIGFCGLDRIGKDEDAALGVRIIYQKIGTIEKANEDDADTPNGSVFGENFTSNSTGQSFLKARLKQMYGEVNGSFRPYIEELQENAQQVQLALTTVITKSSKDGNTYENVRINEVEILETPMDLPAGYKAFEYEAKL